jgi:hypothetical protein
VVAIGTFGAASATAGAANQAALISMGAIEALAALYLGWRALFRQAVLASRDGIIVQNRFRTHRASASDISGLTFAKKAGRFSTYWVGRILLRNGSGVWMIVIGGSSSRRPIPPTAQQELADLATCLGVPVTPIDGAE